MQSFDYFACLYGPSANHPLIAGESTALSGLGLAHDPRAIRQREAKTSEMGKLVTFSPVLYIAKCSDNTAHAE